MNAEAVPAQSGTGVPPVESSINRQAGRLSYSAAPVLSPRQIELKRLISECREMSGRWGGLRALLERIERNDTLEDIGGELEVIASAHNRAFKRALESQAVADRLYLLMLKTKAESGTGVPPVQSS
ncbi:MAG: hypothetical protein NTY01_09330, partial [Verrucomicrobia bacterium]|nr:hypothetical protein [Verrucomicrobiota bacterium]